MQTRKSPLRTLSVLLTVAVLFGVLACLPVGADPFTIPTDGDFAYNIRNDEATIIAYVGSSDSVVIPSEILGYPVTTIGASAFSLFADVASDFTSVTIPTSVRTIRERAFSNTKLTSVTIPASVTEIGEGVFGMCSDLESIAVEAGNPSYEAVNNCLIERSTDKLLRGCVDSVIPSSVRALGAEAFSGCLELTSVAFPAGLESIGREAFYRCSSITSVTIPANVTSIGDAVFNGCPELNSITVQAGNTNYEVVNNCLIEKGSDKLIWGCIDSVVPDGVKVIGESAFSGCPLTEVVLPDSVTTIGDYAFSYCDKLTSVKLPDSVKSIGDYAFSYCDKLTSVKLPDSVKSIGDNAFWACLSLTDITIPNGVTSIGVYAFGYCPALKSVVIPDSVTKMGQTVFGYCDGLTVFCETDSQPEGWDENWMEAYEGSIAVVWGYRSPASLGDVNGDETLNANDYMMLKRYVLHTFSLTDEQLAVADINADGDVNANDYMILKRAVLGTYKLPTE